MQKLFVAIILEKSVVRERHEKTRINSKENIDYAHHLTPVPGQKFFAGELNDNNNRLFYFVTFVDEIRFLGSFNIFAITNEQENNYGRTVES